MVIAAEHSVHCTQQRLLSLLTFSSWIFNLHLSGWLSSAAHNHPTLLTSHSLSAVLSSSFTCTPPPSLASFSKTSSQKKPTLVSLLYLLYLCSFRSLCPGTECLLLLHLSNLNLTQVPPQPGSHLILWFCDSWCLASLFSRTLVLSFISKFVKLHDCWSLPVVLVFDCETLSIFSFYS